MLTPRPGQSVAPMLGLVQDEPAFRAGSARCIAGQDLRAALFLGNKVGSEAWSFLISPRNVIYIWMRTCGNQSQDDVACRFGYWFQAPLSMADVTLVKRPLVARAGGNRHSRPIVIAT